ncbi:hypothetical protein BKA93DRAFT_547509 [Sparassis latifolia]
MSSLKAASRTDAWPLVHEKILRSLGRRTVSGRRLPPPRMSMSSPERVQTRNTGDRDEWTETPKPLGTRRSMMEQGRGNARGSQWCRWRGEVAWSGYLRECAAWTPCDGCVRKDAARSSASTPIFSTFTLSWRIGHSAVPPVVWEEMLSNLNVMFRMLFTLDSIIALLYL